MNDCPVCTSRAGIAEEEQAEHDAGRAGMPPLELFELGMTGGLALGAVVSAASLLAALCSKHRYEHDKAEAYLRRRLLTALCDGGNPKPPS